MVAWVLLIEGKEFEKPKKGKLSSTLLHLKENYMGLKKNANNNSKQKNGAFKYAKPVNH